MIAHVHSLFLISLLNCFVESLLFRVIRYTALADNIDLDLSRVFQFSFDLRSPSGRNTWRAFLFLIP